MILKKIQKKFKKKNKPLPLRVLSLKKGEKRIIKRKLKM
jgi:hypothetical protein